MSGLSFIATEAMCSTADMWCCEDDSGPFRCNGPVTIDADGIAWCRQCIEDGERFAEMWAALTADN